MSEERTKPRGGCADCERDYDAFEDFHVETAIWNYVFAGQAQTTYTVRAGTYDSRLVPRAEGLGGLLCLDCFRLRAEGLGIDFSDYLRDPTAADLSTGLEHALRLIAAVDLGPEPFPIARRGKGAVMATALEMRSLARRALRAEEERDAALENKRKLGRAADRVVEQRDVAEARAEGAEAALKLYASHFGPGLDGGA